ncbi:HNH endonuclease signature motif containing protein [Polaromonas sp.]|uniref:HNH endonuclease n=1 Tax=Polaromonas sp. TaxID=1869339 RepID=UPI0025D5B030|nr:HNH endonuclease signature motif containing protein [Polaromonas sp.]
MRASPDIRLALEEKPLRYWWVNQNQTYRQEIQGGYLWSPKRKSNQARNPFYDFMREVAPGDVVFSFAGTVIAAIGTATSHAQEAPKPAEFGLTGAYWENIGWRVNVSFVELRSRIRPSDYMDVLAPLLQRLYAPLRPDGVGMQGVYLTYLTDAFAAALVDLLGAEARSVVMGFRVTETDPPQSSVIQLQWEDHLIAQIKSDNKITETEKETVVMARRGQGLFKQRVMELERACRITGVTKEEHLRASHCKPWRDSSNQERLDGENGLLLTPTMDHLFDQGFIGFEGNGDLLISPVAHMDSLARMGLSRGEKFNVGNFSLGQRNYLEYHREEVLLRSKFLAQKV